ncbi:MAG: glutamate 5-kinase [Woeseiaceae bacterium]
MSKPALNQLRRLVVKIGSSLLTGSDGCLDTAWLQSLAEDIAELRRKGHDVLIVSSGAVAVGSQILGIDRHRARLEGLQAAAAAGQVQLVHAYQEALEKYGIQAAQVLLTPDDTEIRRRFLNARGTLEKLLEHDVVPVINENDTVATDELRYGDNDRLAARVAQTVMADGLILLSDVDGFYTKDPRIDSAAEFIPLLTSIDDKHLAMAGGTGSSNASGGMATKLLAAKIATHAGCATIIASGVDNHPLRSLENGAKHSLFTAPETPKAARKQWLAGVLDVNGELSVDDGAAEALGNGKSLLPVGLVDVTGDFQRGDAVSIKCKNGLELGRGLAAYSSDEAVTIKGCRSDQIEAVLGYRGRSVLVHRDDLVLFDAK